MAVYLCRLPLLVVALLVCILLSDSIAANVGSVNSMIHKWSEKEVIRSHQKIMKLRAGEAVMLGKRKKQKPTFIYMIKAFFSGQVEVLTDKQKKAAKAKGKKNKLGAGPFGIAGPSGGASFGPVCGPNGCR